VVGRHTMFSGCRIICYQTCRHGILTANEPILMLISISSLWGNGTKQTTFGGIGDERYQLHRAEERSEGMVDASFSTALGRIAFLVTHHWLQLVHGYCFFGSFRLWLHGSVCLLVCHAKWSNSLQIDQNIPRWSLSFHCMLLAEKSKVNVKNAKIKKIIFLP